MTGGIDLGMHMLQKAQPQANKRKHGFLAIIQMMLHCHPLPCQRLGDGQHGNGNYYHKMVQ